VVHHRHRGRGPSARHSRRPTHPGGGRGVWSRRDRPV